MFVGKQVPSIYCHRHDPAIRVQVVKVITQDAPSQYEIVYRRLDYEGAPLLTTPKEAFDAAFVRMEEPA